MTWRDLEQYTFEYLMEQALSMVPNTLDKREGSIIYDALAPAMYQLAEFYQHLRTNSMNSFVTYATGVDLDERGLLQGITRFPATNTKVMAEFKDLGGNLMDVPIGSQFTSANIDPDILYIVLSKESVGVFILEAVEAGNYANSYSGELLPLTSIRGLAQTQITEIVFFGSDIESDELFRKRIIDVVSDKPFGGNITDYDQKVRSIAGVGEVQVYPVWDGGGTVKLSILGSDFLPASPAKVAEVQNLVDPVAGQGHGIAPIGHTVTVVAPTPVPIAVSATVTVSPGYTLAQLQPAIVDGIEAYIKELQVVWGQPVSGNTYSTVVFISRISSIIMGVAGVVNVSNIQINGATTDQTLTQSGTTQQLPVVGTITLS